MGLQRIQHAELRKGHLWYCCQQVWMQNGGRMPWNVAAVFETFKISCLMGKHFTNGDSESDLMAVLFRLERL